MKKEKNKIGYKFLVGLLGLVFKICYRPKIYNKELIPKKGSIIIAGNHMHLFDQNLVCISTKRMVHYMAKIEYFRDWRKAWFFKMAGCIPVDRSIKDENAKDSAVEVLEHGHALGIFPEGTRNKTDKFLLPFKFGVVSMAQKTGSLIVPFAVTGKYKVWEKNNLNIRYGKPFKVPKNMDLAEANEKLFNAITKLKQEGLKAIEDGKN